MKILHNVGWYFPDNVGGTEVYVNALCQALKSNQIESKIFSPIRGVDQAQNYLYNQIPVYRYPIRSELTNEHIEVLEPHAGFEHFCEAVKKESCDVYHQHSITFGCGLYHLKYMKELGVKTVLTIHLVDWVCLRGTMMHYGKTTCSGEIDVNKCSSCWLHSRGAPPIVNFMNSLTPQAVSRMAWHWKKRSLIRSILSTKAFTEWHKKRFEATINYCDKVVVVADWMESVLVRNGVPKNKIVVSRIGMDAENENYESQKDTYVPPSDTLRMAYIGRWHRVKGIEMLVHVLRSLPSHLKYQLTMYCIDPQNDEAKAYKTKIQKMIAQESRIKIERSLQHHEVPSTLKQYDAVVVPSICLEMGPYSALESLAVGVPVIGSNLGGIREVVSHDETGYLVNKTTDAEWKKVFLNLLSHPEKIQRWKDCLQGRQVRSMKTVADEMQRVYQELV